ncbi:MAG: hypothetical protein WA632_07605 [Gallionella sp.]
MKKIALMLCAAAVVSTPAMADGRRSVGFNYGLDNDGVVGIQGEFDLSSSANNAPVSGQVFWKGYSKSYDRTAGKYQYTYSGFGVAALYDFGPVIKQNTKIRPYAALGLYTLNNKLSGPTTPSLGVSADSGGLYVAGGVRFAVSPEIRVDLGLNNIGGLSAGLNFNF